MMQNPSPKSMSSRICNIPEDYVLPEQRNELDQRPYVCTVPHACLISHCVGLGECLREKTVDIVTAVQASLVLPAYGGVVDQPSVQAYLCSWTSNKDWPRYRTTIIGWLT